MFNRRVEVTSNLKHYVEIYLQFGPFIDKREFEVKERNPILMVNILKEDTDDCHRILKFKFYDRVETYFSDNTCEIDKTNYSCNYYFGKRINLSQVSMINNHRGYFDDMAAFDEYQVGGVIHSQSSVVLPLFTNDIIISEELDLTERNVKVKQMYKKYGI
jgi:hypothetical protein